MLIRLNVKNFLSFSERKIGNDKLSHEFCLIAGKTRQKDEHLFKVNNIKALKFSAIYGANNAGKTNLIKALSFIKQTVISGLPEGSSKMFCRTKPENKLQPSYFEIQFSIGEHCYSYGFEVVLSKGEFISEWLVEINGQNEYELFTRDIKNGITTLSKKIFSSKLKIYSDDISDDSSALLVTAMNQNKNHFYNEHSEALPLYYVFEWLNNKLKILSSNLEFSYMFNAAKYDEICCLLRSFDTGITGYEIKTESPNTILFKHGDFTLPLNRESAGTIQLLILLRILLLDENDDTYIIDNLDSGRSLHPLLTYQFVKRFLNLTNKLKRQLIVTSHETLLLNFDLLRRDEIWFVEKNIQGESRTYSLDEYNVRFDKVIDKAYLEGRYGSIPIIKNEVN